MIGYRYTKNQRFEARSVISVELLYNKETIIWFKQGQWTGKTKSEKFKYRRFSIQIHVQLFWEKQFDELSHFFSTDEASRRISFFGRCVERNVLLRETLPAANVAAKRRVRILHFCDAKGTVWQILEVPAFLLDFFFLCVDLLSERLERHLQVFNHRFAMFLINDLRQSNNAVDCQLQIVKPQCQ